jgi:hypothetical protein
MSGTSVWRLRQIWSFLTTPGLKTASSSRLTLSSARCWPGPVQSALQSCLSGGSPAAEQLTSPLSSRPICSRWPTTWPLARSSSSATTGCAFVDFRCPADQSLAQQRMALPNWPAEGNQGGAAARHRVRRSPRRALALGRPRPAHPRCPGPAIPPDPSGDSSRILPHPGGYPPPGPTGFRG